MKKKAFLSVLVMIGCAIILIIGQSFSPPGIPDHYCNGPACQPTVNPNNGKTVYWKTGLEGSEIVCCHEQTSPNWQGCQRSR